MEKKIFKLKKGANQTPNTIPSTSQSCDLTFSQCPTSVPVSLQCREVRPPDGHLDLHRCHEHPPALRPCGHLRWVLLWGALGGPGQDLGGSFHCSAPVPAPLCHVLMCSLSVPCSDLVIGVCHTLGEIRELFPSCLGMWMILWGSS